MATFSLAACGHDKTGLEDPDQDGKEEGGIVSIAYLKSFYVNRPFTIDSETAIRGVVTSSDRRGNFYKTLVLEDPSGGIAVRIDLEDYFTIFPLGSTVTLFCNNLTLGTYGGAVQLGTAALGGSNDVGLIPADRLLSFATVHDTGQEPPVKILSIPALSPADIHRSVEIAEVQFEDWKPGLPWGDEGTDTDRTLVDREGNRIVVRTSRHATFAADPLPAGSGSIRGILGYFNGNYQLTLINGIYADMEGERF